MSCALHQEAGPSDELPESGSSRRYSGNHSAALYLTRKRLLTKIDSVVVAPPMADPMILG